MLFKDSDDPGQQDPSMAFCKILRRCVPWKSGSRGLRSVRGAEQDLADR
jgi:hypothetical protein